MLRILHDTKIDFIRLWKITTVVTLLFMVPGIIAIAISGYHYSVEFTGGTLMQVSFPKAPDVGDVRSTLDAAGIKGAEIQTFGRDTALVIRAQDPRSVAQQTRGAESVAGQITAALTKKFGPSPKNFRVDRTEAVGPKVGGELRQKAFIAILVSFLFTLGYLAWRFDWRFGLAAVIATAHDILGTLAFIKYLNLEISLIVVGGVLTMIGYSLNDTIIIFDRVREDLRKRRKESLYETLNRGVNETLPRSVLTHTTTFACLVALALVGGEVIRPFALVMIFGVVTGTFSSIYVAPVILMWIERKWPRAVGDRGVVNARSAREAPASSPQQQRRKAAGES
ncbi:MAG TPA: protein translocase subunit SecF [Gemmatimonadaceae bacterium]|nr:protein translocase subunit SecF [Gemmatimonadaceae bacterium]